MAIPLGILYVLLNRRARHRLRNARLARALLVELRLVRGAFRKIGEEENPAGFVRSTYRIAHGKQRDALRSVYDGLLASSNIAYFGSDLQKGLHDAYTGFNRLAALDHVTGSIDYSEISTEKSRMGHELRTMDKAITGVEAFYNHNRYRGKWLRLLKALCLEYED